MNTGIIILIGAVIVALFIIMASCYTKAGPNEVLIISGGRRKYRTVSRGGGRVVWPVLRRAQYLSLELMTLELRTPEVYTANAVPATVDGVAQVKVAGDDESINHAAEQFLSKSQEDVRKTALQTLEGHMRAILGTMTVEEIYTNRKGLAQKIKEAASEDLASMGLEIVSLTVRNISDSHGYLEALGRPRIAQVKRDAVRGEAEADREAKTARFQADTKIEEARRDHEVNKALYQASMSEKKAESDLAYDLHRFKVMQVVKREEVKVSIVEKDMAIELQEREIARKEKELEAEVRKVAEAESYKIQTLAQAERYRLEAEAEGEAAAIKSQGFAEAEVIRAKGLSEAEAMLKKAESWSHYNEAAITEMFVDILPQLAQAVAEPLSKTEKIVIISTGGDSSGASKVTRDVAEVLSQLPPVVESLTGVKLEEMLSRIAGGKQSAGPSKESRK